eukprot:3225033-Prymnesium_polylepis.1
MATEGVAREAAAVAKAMEEVAMGRVAAARAMVAVATVTEGAAMGRAVAARVREPPVRAAATLVEMAWLEAELATTAGGKRNRRGTCSVD